MYIKEKTWKRFKMGTSCWVNFLAISECIRRKIGRTFKNKKSAAKGNGRDIGVE